MTLPFLLWTSLISKHVFSSVSSNAESEPGDCTSYSELDQNYVASAHAVQMRSSLCAPDSNVLLSDESENQAHCRSLIVKHVRFAELETECEFPCIMFRNRDLEALDKQERNHAFALSCYFAIIVLILMIVLIVVYA